MYDLGIIGAGPGGYETALYAVKKGLKVVLFEKEKLGGTCLNRGCIPTKTILASAKLVRNFEKSENYGLNISSDFNVNYSQIIARKDKVVELSYKGIASSLKKAGVDVVSAKAQIIGPNQIEADQKKIDVKNIIVATGTKVSSLKNIIIDSNKIISSDDILTMEKLPESILIVGGGVMGCEFAFILSAFGVWVTIIESADKVLPFVDKDISNLIAREMKKSKIKVILSTTIEQANLLNNSLEVNLSDGSVINPEQLLITVGRKKIIEGLGFENLNIKVDKFGSVAVDEKMETTCKGIYAIGDITGKKMLAHVASAQGRVVVDSLVGDYKPLCYENIPAAIFTMPEVATVGMAEQDVVSEYEVVMYQYRMLGKAHAEGKIEGFFKVIFAKESRLVLGCHIVGEHSSDIIMEATIAMNNNMTVDSLVDTVHPHPSFCEGLQFCLME